jgi:queuine/archaeosine tRNA-ribosyltransferase
MIITFLRRLLKGGRMIIKTKHGEINCPNFFPVIGWPAGRGEYDRLFESLDYFCSKLQHNHFLFNFASFAMGFSIPKTRFNSAFDSFKNSDLRESLVEANVNESTAKSLVILLDVGGNRIFNKLVLDNKDVSKPESYELYINAYFDFIKKANVDIYVSFDIGPSYTAKDEISKKGVAKWNSLSPAIKCELSKRLLEESIKRKDKGSLVMVPISGCDVERFNTQLQELFSKFKDSVDYIAVGGIANRNFEHVNEVLKSLRGFLIKNKWDVKTHGLGLGGWENIPLLIKYDIDTCDVATAWRRACTDAISNMYVPLFDDKLNLTSYGDAFKCYEIYDKIWDKITCNCPFCKDTPIKEIQKIYKAADKNKIGSEHHANDYYKMRIRIFYHNVFQHIAFLKKLHSYKLKHGENFLKEFVKEVKSERLKKRLNKLA